MRHISMNFNHILMQGILISRASPCRTVLIHIPAGLLRGGASGDKTGSICRAVKKTKQEVQQNGHTDKERGEASERKMAGTPGLKLITVCILMSQRKHVCP
jgi:hypothetical protein